MESWWDFGDNYGHQGGDLATYAIGCGFCNTQGNFATAHHTEKQNASGKKLNYDILRCENCGNLTMVFWAAGDSGLHDFKAFPYPLRYTKFPDSWPADVGRYWLQAKQAQVARNL